MPPKTAKAAPAGDAGDGRKQPTAQEAYLFYTIIKNMKGKPEIDWAAVAVDAGFKNAETAKVRYGQIKRKLGLDNWNAGKAKDAKDEDAGDDGAPETPAAARIKKAAATPSTGGTGAGVKKRANTGKRATNSTPGGRSRKAKSQALIKMEVGMDQDLNLEEDEDVLAIESPTKKSGSRIKNEFGAVGHHLNVNNEFDTFPATLPDAVLERQAILVYVNGTWTTSPVPIEVHAQWLARLPAHIQTRFYTQASGANMSQPADNGNGNGFLANDDNDNNPNIDAAALQAQLLNEHFGGPNMLSSMGMSMCMAGVEVGNYVSASATGVGQGHGNGDDNGNRNNGNQAVAAAEVDLHSIPMHPGYMAQMEREAREQEARDHAMLFGNGSGFC
ncbi:hypothetical protein N657DRAFT_683287 [Parathielavia appendiculata]|uniref:Myb-like DNA-binding domain-containing protein n=1 Tax=Parathielavia appendiculata TaxID=2587402 RepID=A0AAN6Z0A0_9PEZI|nr:hypothetical protein N657DRAFT_683287 [Parathielavia appendiculata]